MRFRHRKSRYFLMQGKASLDTLSLLLMDSGFRQLDVVAELVPGSHEMELSRGGLTRVPRLG